MEDGTDALYKLNYETRPTGAKRRLLFDLPVEPTPCEQLVRRVVRCVRKPKK
jgi:hypothetical protein